MNNEITHDEYYSQFVNDGVKQKVVRCIGLNALLRSKDEHLNDIPLNKWDCMGGFAFSGSRMTMKPTNIRPISYGDIKEAGEDVSASTLVCIYKNAAKQIINEHLEKDAVN